MPVIRPNSLLLDQFIRTPAALLTPAVTKAYNPPPYKSSFRAYKMSENPGLIGSHAQYVKGAAVEAIGSVTGSQEWQNSGDADKAEAVKDMRKASENRDPAQSGMGKAEELAGKAVGCEGMKEEGAASKTQ